jgi:hypothetical protein
MRESSEQDKHMSIETQITQIIGQKVALSGESKVNAIAPQTGR